MSNTTVKRPTMGKVIGEINTPATRRIVFLQAWKDGIGLVGDACFQIPARGVVDATDRDALRPDFEAIENALLVMGTGERHLLLAMCQFFTDSGTRCLCEDSGVDLPSLADLALLDDAHRSVVARLMDSYRGW